MIFNVKENLINSLRLKYEADILAAHTTIHIYLNNSVGIGEHPQHLEEIDKLLEKISSARDKLGELAHL
uniref:Uncharacterized protein n=1 Tax=Megaviridae environmental sample TaxID=1737588 RepID=A0A5J6VL40_9VIRU|nr:MAG: hypothetical protein [Megaviridae environmental sample]